MWRTVSVKQRQASPPPMHWKQADPRVSFLNLVFRGSLSAEIAEVQRLAQDEGPEDGLSQVVT